MRWQVEYTDGKLVREPDNYHTLDRERVKSIAIIDDNEKPMHTMLVPEGATFFHRKRGFAWPGGGTEIRILGYWHGSIVKVWFIAPNGKVDFLPHFIRGHAVYGDIVPFNEEQAHRVRCTNAN